jgi:hypothetical protein
VGSQSAHWHIARPLLSAATGTNGWSLAPSSQLNDVPACLRTPPAHSHLPLPGVPELRNFVVEFAHGARALPGAATAPLSPPAPLAAAASLASAAARHAAAVHRFGDLKLARLWRRSRRGRDRAHWRRPDALRGIVRTAAQTSRRSSPQWAAQMQGPGAAARRARDARPCAGAFPGQRPPEGCHDRQAGRQHRCALRCSPSPIPS